LEEYTIKMKLSFAFHDAMDVNFLVHSMIIMHRNSWIYIQRKHSGRKAVPTFVFLPFPSMVKVFPVPVCP
jgi:hypothetical protein